MTKPKNRNPAPPAEAPKVFPAGSAKARDVVTVACKSPNGLLLRLFEQVDNPVPVLGGGTRMEKRAVQVGEMVRLHGAEVPVGVAPVALIAGGFALTPNVDKNFITEWLKQNRDHEMVKKGLIFIASDRSSAMDEANEKAGLRSGLERLAQDPGKDPRTPKGPTPKNVTPLEKADVASLTG